MSREEFFERAYSERTGCGGPLYLACVILAVMMLFGCKSVSSVETNNESRKVSELVDKMDSLVSRTATWQQDIYQKQTSLVDSFRQKEKSDSSHSVVVNEKGDTIRERIEIYRYIETDHSSEKEESEVWMQKFKEVDSLLRVSLDNQAVTDSLIREHEKEVVKEKQLTLWQKIKVGLGGYAIVFALIIFILLVYRIIRWLRRKSL